MAVQHGVTDAAHKRLANQELHYFFSIAHMPRHAQAQRLYALQNKPGGVRTHAGTKVAQAFAPRAQQESTHGAFLAEIHAMKSIVRCSQLGKLATACIGLGPVKTATVDHHAAYHGAVATQKFGGGVINQIGSQAQRLH